MTLYAARDPGASQARPQSKARPRRPPLDRPADRSTRPDSLKYMQTKRRFKEAIQPHSILSFQNWEPAEFAIIAPMILRSVKESPAAWVAGEEKFLTGAGLNEGREFLLAAGFGVECVDRLLQ